MAALCVESSAEPASCCGIDKFHMMFQDCADYYIYNNDEKTYGPVILFVCKSSNYCFIQIFKF